MTESQYTTPIFLIPKKGGDIRMCVDYGALNAIIIKKMYLLAMIADQLDKLAGKKYFITLDSAQKYYQVPMHPDCQWPL